MSFQGCGRYKTQNAGDSNLNLLRALVSPEWKKLVLIEVPFTGNLSGTVLERVSVLSHLVLLTA